MTDPEKLAAFVTARIDETEREASESPDADWGGRVSAVVASQRAMLSAVEKLRTGGDADSDWAWLEPGGAVIDWVLGYDPADQAKALAIDLLRAVALAYRDHPDFDQSWRPEY